MVTYEGEIHTLIVLIKVVAVLQCASLHVSQLRLKSALWQSCLLYII